MVDLIPIKIAQNQRWMPIKFKEKEIYTDFQLDEEDRNYWIDKGFSKAKHLLDFLEGKYGTNGFRLILTETQCDFFKINEGEVTDVIVNYSKYREYTKELKKALDKLLITKYNFDINSEFSKKLPDYFFRKEGVEGLIKELDESEYQIIEQMLSKFGSLTDEDKKKIIEGVEHSEIGSNIIDKYSKLTPESPEQQLKLFLKVVDKLGEKEVGELLNSLLKSKISGYLIKRIGKLSVKEQSRISKDMTKMTIMYNRYTDLKKSLTNFEKMIKEHKESSKKNEREIHQYIINNYWLLGVEYFDKDIKSDIDKDGNKTGETKKGRYSADIIIERIDGTKDRCVVIELEEANDTIFTKTGISYNVFDGIKQAIMYSVKERATGKYSKGIAVIGSVHGMELSKQQRTELNVLRDHLPNIEILTYEDIIEKAKTTLKFFEKYEFED